MYMKQDSTENEEIHSCITMQKSSENVFMSPETTEDVIAAISPLLQHDSEKGLALSTDL
jgi:hypothetical protein